ncbi:Arm DNA-binding domain-containing protein [Pseudomonas aeruginosa]|nr:Arm DNA-binding domain-containing protein [Pseudomonas aeruginosa]
MALSDTAVRQAKAVGKAYTLGDSDGLALAVSLEGSKSWHFRYTWNSRQKRLSLGTYPEIFLKEARTRRDIARELVARGINPRKQKIRSVGTPCSLRITPSRVVRVSQEEPEGGPSKPEGADSAHFPKRHPANSRLPVRLRHQAP